MIRSALALLSLRQKCTDDSDLHKCQGCPRTFHKVCLPKGHVKLAQGNGENIHFLCELCASVGNQALIDKGLTQGRGSAD